MATLSPAQIYSLATGAGLSASAATVATGVALAESGGRTDAVGDVGLQDAKWGPSIGLWQIRSVKAEYGKGTSRDGSRLADPAFNAHAMAEISGTGGNWRPWSTYNNGSYKKQLSKLGITDAAAAALGSIPVVGSGLAGMATGLGSAADAVAGAFDWAAPAMKIGLYVLGGGAAVALVVVGAVHTVSDK